jgi:mannosylglycerate hydrolase
MKRKLHVISHTHWDREWYQDFQGMRKRLVYFIDELLEVLENKSEYKYFHMDGQTIVLEDYLAIKPENEQRLRKLIKDGRIIIGPWYVMPDEFLVSGESLIRNLLKGHLICEDYDTKAFKNGYITDIFGHNSQLPQILKGFDINSATLYRGIGDFEKSEFLWEAADGSKVLALKLDPDRSYSNFYFAIRWPFDGREYEAEEVKSRMGNLLKYMEPKVTTRHYLMMDGVDHMEVEPKLPELINTISEMENVEVVHTTIEEFTKELMEDKPELETIKGELIDPGCNGVNNSVLKNVWSSMVTLKQMNNECETMLTSWAEPLSSVRDILGIGEYQQGFFTEAWKNVLMNHPHDSICGCSITRVHMDNEYRFNQAKSITEEMLEEDLNDIQKNIDTSIFKEGLALTLYNNGQTTFKGVVLAELELPVIPEGIHNILLLDKEGNEVIYQIVDIQKNKKKRTLEVRKLPQWENVDKYIIAFESSIPSLGYTTLNYQLKNVEQPKDGEYTFHKYYQRIRYTGSMQRDLNHWENEFFNISVNVNGTLNISDKLTKKKYENLLIFEDGADVGDGWNYRCPVHDKVVTGLTAVSSFSVESSGALFTRLCVETKLSLPNEIKTDRINRSESNTELNIKTIIDIRMGSRRIDFTSTVDNNVRDHRLRVLFPTGIDSEDFYTSTPFDLYKRSVKRADNSNYNEIDTKVSPNQGVTIIKDSENSFSLFNKGLYEVELIDNESKTIALTLFRSFNSEVGQDEPKIGNLIQKLKFEYSIYIDGSKETNGQLMLEGKAYKDGIKFRCDKLHSGNLPMNNSFIDFNIPGAIISCFKKAERANLFVIRMFNCEEKEINGYLNFLKPLKQAYLLNMNEEIIDTFEVKKAINLKLRAKEIVTLGVGFNDKN